MTSIISKFYGYSAAIFSALQSVDVQKIEELNMMLESSLTSNVFIFGNGGSAAISDHFCCDFNKGIYQNTGYNPRAISLTANGPLLTAIANDINYEMIFAYQLMVFARSDSTRNMAIAVSSSGNSPNIINGLQEASSQGMKTAALVGFDGGAILKENLADIVVHVNANNYGVVEDCHMSILHILTQNIRSKYQKDPGKTIIL